MRSIIFAAVGGLMLLAASPAKAEVQFPDYPFNIDGCAGTKSICSSFLDGLLQRATISWQKASEKDRRDCLANVSKAAQMRGGFEPYNQLLKCLADRWPGV